MTYIAKPKFHHPGLKKNELGYTHRDYEGKISTLCAGCGHDSITASIIEACYELSIEPHRVAKISGIGCSSKTPDYFLGNSHGFNSVHGRMPSVLTGANLANRDLIYLGVSGDGDSGFAHALLRLRRRELLLEDVLARLVEARWGLLEPRDLGGAEEIGLTRGGSRSLDSLSAPLDLSSGTSFEGGHLARTRERSPRRASLENGETPGLARIPP